MRIDQFSPPPEGTSKTEDFDMLAHLVLKPPKKEEKDDDASSSEDISVDGNIY